MKSGEWSECPSCGDQIPEADRLQQRQECQFCAGGGRVLAGRSLGWTDGTMSDGRRCHMERFENATPGAAPDTRLAAIYPERRLRAGELADGRRS